MLDSYALNFLVINFQNIKILQDNFINPLASLCAKAPALKYGYVNTETTSLARSNCK